MRLASFIEGKMFESQYPTTKSTMDNLKSNVEKITNNYEIKEITEEEYEDCLKDSDI